MLDTTAETITIPTTGTYRLDTAGSTITFTAKHLFGLVSVTGSLAQGSAGFTVDLRLKRTAPKCRVHQHDRCSEVRLIEVAGSGHFPLDPGCATRRT